LVVARQSEFSNLLEEDLELISDAVYQIELEGKEE